MHLPQWRNQGGGGKWAIAHSEFLKIVFPQRNFSKETLCPSFAQPCPLNFWASSSFCPLVENSWLRHCLDISSEYESSGNNHATHAMLQRYLFHSLLSEIWSPKPTCFHSRLPVPPTSKTQYTLHKWKLTNWGNWILLQLINHQNLGFVEWNSIGRWRK